MQWLPAVEKHQHNAKNMRSLPKNTSQTGAACENFVMDYHKGGQGKVRSNPGSNFCHSSSRQILHTEEVLTDTSVGMDKEVPSGTVLVEVAADTAGPGLFRPVWHTSSLLNALISGCRRRWQCSTRCPRTCPIRHALYASCTHIMRGS